MLFRRVQTQEHRSTRNTDKTHEMVKELFQKCKKKLFEVQLGIL